MQLIRSHLQLCKSVNRCIHSIMNKQHAVHFQLSSQRSLAFFAGLRAPYIPLILRLLKSPVLGLPLQRPFVNSCARTHTHTIALIHCSALHITHNNYIGKTAAAVFQTPGFFMSHELFPPLLLSQITGRKQDEIGLERACV